MKKCSNCKTEKPKSDFYTSTVSRDGLNYRCKECEKARRRKYVAANHKEVRDKHLSYQRKRKYGITQSQFDDMLKEQDSKCLICTEQLDLDVHGSSTKKCVVDHDHNTGRVRGLLCRVCNQGIGLLRDNIENLNRAINYLRK